MNPNDRSYSEDHEWVKVEDGTATIGISDYAQDKLTDVVFVELPEVGRNVKVGESVAVLESVKSVADIYTPVTGEIIEVNTNLEDHPELINDDPFGDGWILKINVSSPNLSSLLDAEAYQTYTDGIED